MRIERRALAFVLAAACRTNAAAPNAADANVAASAPIEVRRDAPAAPPSARVPAPPACARAEAERLAAEHTYARARFLRALGELSPGYLADAESRLRRATADVARLQCPRP